MPSANISFLPIVTGVSIPLAPSDAPAVTPLQYMERLITLLLVRDLK